MIKEKQTKKWTKNTYFIHFYITGGYIFIHKKIKKEEGYLPLHQ